MLTRKQQQLLLFVHERLQEEGVPPSFDEMKDALDLKSKSGIHRLITALEERGFIRRLANRARALEVLKLPEGHESRMAAPVDGKAANAPAQRGFNPRVIEGDMSGSKAGHRSGTGLAEPSQAAYAGSTDKADNSSFQVPVMGRIAAGVPISAIQDHTHSITIPPDMMGSGEHYALEVKGDSMIEAGIHDGDTVVIRQTPSATPGDIVVALVDDEEATLKTYRRNGNSIALEAANPAYETRILPQERVKVQGKLVGLLRSYH